MQKKLFNRKTFIFYVLAINYIFLSTCYSSEVHPDAGSTAATFLKIPVGARASAMGGYYAMVGDDVSLLYWNPAGIAEINSSLIEFSYKEYFQGIKHNFLGYATLLKNSVVGFGITSFFVDGIEARSGLLDINDAYVNLYQVTPVEYYFGILDLSINGSYARKINNKWSLGVNAKIISQKVDTYTGHSFALDLGSNWILKKNLWLGVVIKNFGLPIKLDKESYNLPLELDIGLLHNYRNINFVFNLNQPIDNYLISSFGVEYNVLEHISLRTGYKYKLYGWELGNEAGLSAGLGFNFYGTKLDYGITSYGILGFVHNVSFGIDFKEFNNMYKNIRKKFGNVSVQKNDTKQISTQKEQTKVEVLQPIALNPINENVYKELVSKQYSIKTRNKILSYDSTNKIYLYNFVTTEPVVLESTGDKKLVLEKVEGKFSSRNKFNITEEKYVVINSAVVNEGLETKLPLGQKVVQIITVDKYLDTEIFGIATFFSQKNYNKLQFYVIDKNLQKVEPEVFYTEKGFLYKINLPKNLKVVIVKVIYKNENSFT
ncbi:MAG: PorV/PorQ family protein [Endomicrobiia bacterium]